MATTTTRAPLLSAPHSTSKARSPNKGAAPSSSKPLRSPSKSRHPSSSKKQQSSYKTYHDPTPADDEDEQGLSVGMLKAKLQDYQIECTSRLRAVQNASHQRISTLARQCRTPVVTLPDQLRSMKVSEFFDLYGGDLDKAFRGVMDVKLKKGPSQVEMSVRKGKRPAASSPRHPNAINKPPLPEQSPTTATKKARPHPSSYSQQSPTKLPTSRARLVGLTSPASSSADVEEWDLMSHAEASRVEDSNTVMGSRSGGNKLQRGGGSMKKAASSAKGKKTGATPTASRETRSRSNSASAPSMVPTLATFSPRNLPHNAPSYLELFEAQKRELLREEEERRRQFEMRKRQFEESMRRVLRETNVSGEERRRLEEKLAEEMRGL
ncbi:hypothetical protein MNV49_003467 [Pseudohyphozyma bogoriensis]|nr:hypothetical protein MNV49_003467 [Pseudohyphozyma bogoriensis]